MELLAVVEVPEGAEVSDTLGAKLSDGLPDVVLFELFELSLSASRLCCCLSGTVVVELTGLVAL